MSAGARLRQLLGQNACLVTPGCWDGLSARIAEHAGFAAAAISGFGVEASVLGMPDIGTLTASELVDQARRMASATTMALTCDVGSGVGGVHSIARLVREMEQAGIAGIQIEDQPDKRQCPSIAEPDVVSTEEQIVRLRAALSARQDDDFLIIARCDAAHLGFDEVVRRCNAYLAAGADMAMPVVLHMGGRNLRDVSAEEQMQLHAALAQAIDGPVKGIAIPAGYTAHDMGKIGYQIIGLTGFGIEAAAGALYEAMVSLAQTGNDAAYRAEHPSPLPAPHGIAELLRAGDHLEFERRCLGSGSL